MPLIKRENELFLTKLRDGCFHQWVVTHQLDGDTSDRFIVDVQDCSPNLGLFYYPVKFYIVFPISKNFLEILMSITLNQ